MNIQGIETHKYAPELNRALINGVWFKCPSMYSIRDLRDFYFKPVKKGRYARIEYINTEYPYLTKVYQGYCSGGYQSIMTVLKWARNRHNMPSGYFKISIKYIG